MSEEQQEPQYDETVEVTTLLGKGCYFEGKLTFEGTVRIDGVFAGEIFSDDILVVGPGGLVRAELDVGTVVVEGTVEGNIRAKKSVEIHAPGRVRGSIITPSLFIDRGVVFEGNCQMHDAEAEEQPAEEFIDADPPPPSETQEKGIGNVSTAGTIDPTSEP
jgi:cytoskeletal protein CcmA (bactofilin family)